MITESTVRSVSTIGDVVEASYTIEDSAKIFSILRSNIYSNKILAVIREYSTNGWDGHVMAGTPDRPIQVTLPTTLSPVFKVRDFGVGMSEETVMQVYTSYGTSTKDNSNDFNGTFGLGSKSAFAYGNTFGITSYFNGTKTFYTAYLDESNIGKIRKEFSEPTSEHNGIEIELSVKSSDINLFAENAQSFYRFFNPCPVLLGCPDYIKANIESFHDLPVLYSGSNWSIIEHKTHDWRNTASGTIVMGNVGYPLNFDALNLKDSSLRQLFSNNTMVIINVPIGSVSITASRESLEYDRKTQQFIEDCLLNMQTELIAEIQTKVDSHDTFWESCREFNTSVTVSEGISKGITITKFKDLVYELRASNYSYHSYCRTLTWDSLFIREHILNKFDVELREYNYFNSAQLRSYVSQTIIPSDKYVFALNIPGKVKSNEIAWRVRGARALYPNHTIVLVNFAGKDTSAKLKKGVLAGAKFINLHECDIVKYTNGRTRTVNRIVTNEMTKSKVFSYSRRLSKINSESWTIEEVDLQNDTGVYVLIDKYQPINFDSMSVFEKFVTSLENDVLALDGKDLPKIYGIRSSSKDKIGDGWTELKDWAEKQTNSFIKNRNLTEKFANVYSFEDLQFTIGHSPSTVLGRYWSNTTGYHQIYNNSDLVGTDIYNFVKTAMMYSRDIIDNSAYSIHKIQSVVKFVKHHRINVDFPQKSSLAIQLSEIEDKYPGISYLLANEYGNDAQKQEFKRYLNKMNPDILG